MTESVVPLLLPLTDLKGGMPPNSSSNKMFREGTDRYQFSENWGSPYWFCSRANIWNIITFYCCPMTSNLTLLQAKNAHRQMAFELYILARYALKYLINCLN